LQIQSSIANPNSVPPTTKIQLHLHHLVKTQPPCSQIGPHHHRDVKNQPPCSQIWPHHNNPSFYPLKQSTKSYRLGAQIHRECPYPSNPPLNDPISHLENSSEPSITEPVPCKLGGNHRLQPPQNRRRAPIGANLDA
jgi:hypothetical protein